MKLPVILVTVVGLIALLAIGFLFLRAPQPHIILPGETIFVAGPLNVTNTIIASWVAMILIIGIAIMATRSMQMIPSGLQNFVEGFVEFLYNQTVEIAGEENGRKFFALCATFFIFILVCNWMALLPVFNAIGRTEDVGHEIFEEIAHLHEDGEVFAEDHHFFSNYMDEAGPIGIIKPNETRDFLFDVHAGDEPEVVLDTYIVALAEAYTDFEAAHEDEEDSEGVAQDGEVTTGEDEIDEGEDPDEAAGEAGEGENGEGEGAGEGAGEGEGSHGPSAADVLAAQAALEADPDAPNLLFAEGGEGVPSPGLGQTISGVEFPGQKLAINVPLLRGTFSDANNTIALAIIAFFFIEFWGFQALGFGYLGKFFNFSSPIMLFVGLLELISEFIRIVSFSFRLLGNIFAGEVLVLMLTFLVPFLVVDVIYGLELFVGFIQASVFALLTLVFAVGAVEHHGDDHDEEHGHDAHGHDAGQYPPVTVQPQ